MTAEAGRRRRARAGALAGVVAAVSAAGAGPAQAQTLPGQPVPIPSTRAQTTPTESAPSQSAQTPRAATYLFPDAVLESAAAHFPQVLEGLARVQAARGDVVASEGAFDLVFSADGFTRSTGFWDGSVVNTDVRRRLRGVGATVYGGYRLSDGDFPIYEDINFTNTGGEFKVGALFSILRDRSIDAQRFAATDTRLAADQAELELLLTRIGVQRRALNAYWLWLAAERQLSVYKDLLEIAEARQSGLETQVRRGALAAISLTENRQNITRRRILVVQAQRDFINAANVLSLYYRDSDGDPITPSLGEAPPMDVMPAMPETPELPVTDLVAQRPELELLRVAIQRANNRIALGENALQPSLDLNLEVSRDLGAIAEGGPSRESTDTILGVEFSVPLQRRLAKGRLQRAEAEREAARQQRRRTQDQIEIEIRNILVELETARELAVLAQLEVEQSDRMTEAELSRFASGASDFFLVNVREETAADARVRAAQAAFRARVAQTDFDAAVMNLNRLGLSDQR